MTWVQLNGLGLAKGLFRTVWLAGGGTILDNHPQLLFLWRQTEIITGAVCQSGLAFLEGVAEGDGGEVEKSVADAAKGVGFVGKEFYEDEARVWVRYFSIWSVWSVMRQT